MDIGGTGKPVVIFNAIYNKQVNVVISDNSNGQVVISVTGSQSWENTQDMDSWISEIYHWQLNSDLDISLDPSYCHSLVESVRRYCGEARWILAALTNM